MLQCVLVLPEQGPLCLGQHTARQSETRWAPSGPHSQRRSARGRTAHLGTQMIITAVTQQSQSSPLHHTAPTGYTTQPILISISPHNQSCSFTPHSTSLLHNTANQSCSLTPHNQSACSVTPQSQSACC